MTLALCIVAFFAGGCVAHLAARRPVTHLLEPEHTGDVLKPPASMYRMRCVECDCVFRYALDDCRRHYGVLDALCPSCGRWQMHARGKPEPVAARP